MVSYFAGIFYLVRLFVYFRETAQPEFVESELAKKILQNQYKIMIKKLWNIITVPAFILMLVFGITMILMQPDLLRQNWFHIKLTLLLGLFAYHFWCYNTVKKISASTDNHLKKNSYCLRQLNEVATLLLFSIVFVVILKSNFIDNWKEIVSGLLGIFLLVFMIVKLVNSKKKKT